MTYFHEMANSELVYMGTKDTVGVHGKWKVLTENFNIDMINDEFAS